MTAAGTINLDPAFGWVLLELAIIALQVMLEGFAIGRIRKRIFTKAFYVKNFPELVKGKARLPDMGYPDCGGGQFSQKLEYNDWLDFANAQRAHLSFVEGLGTILTLLTISGLFYPVYATYLGAIYIVGRIAFGIGYRRGGARGRLVGVLLIDIVLLAAFGLAICGAWGFAGGLPALKAVVGL